MERCCTRILVVDDELAVVQMLSEMLCLKGYEVEAAYGGLESIAKIEKSPPDLVLLDLMMPDLDGIEVCRRLSSDQRTRNIPVILVTASNRTEMLARGLEAGAVDYVQKPFQNTELLARVRSALRLKNYMDNLEGIVEERTREITLSEKRYRELVESTEDLIFQTDAEGRVTFINASGAEILGLTTEKVIGAPFLDLVHPDDRQGVIEVSKKLYKGQSIRQYEAQVKTSKDRLRSYIWNVSPRQRTSGEYGGAHGIGRDFSQRKELERRLIEANRLKSQFLANISHELRTPLNAIIGFSQVILRGIDGPLTAQMEEDVSQIHTSGQHLLELINELLDFVKFEAGRIELVRSPVCLKELIGEVTPVFSRLLKQKGLRFDVGIPHGTPLVYVDRPKIKQVVVNLMANAIKFTDEGIIEIWTETDQTAVRVCIRDSGIGIPSYALEYIFEEFRQVNGSPTRSRGGAGLGLAICKKIVELHGGRVSVESQEGRGSTFHFELPIYQGPAMPETDSR